MRGERNPLFRGVANLRTFLRVGKRGRMKFNTHAAGTGCGDNITVCRTKKGLCQINSRGEKKEVTKRESLGYKRKKIGRKSQKDILSAAFVWSLG